MKAHRRPSTEAALPNASRGASALPHPGMLWPAREVVARTRGATILFSRDECDTTYVSGRRGHAVLFRVEQQRAYRIGRYDAKTGEWRPLTPLWPRFGNALAFACSLVS